MIIRSPKPNTGYTVLDNRLLANANLSYRARGVLAFILSKPDHWQTNAPALARASTEGRDAILKALAELEAEGYVIRTRHQDTAGRWTTIVTVFDEPQPACDPTCGQPASPTPEKPNSENQASKQVLTNKYSEHVSDITQETGWRICGHCNGARMDADAGLIPCHYCNGQGLVRDAGR